MKYIFVLFSILSLFIYPVCLSKPLSNPDFIEPPNSNMMNGPEKTVYSMIVVDFNKCTGC
jgi:hypothetical protein